MNEKKNSICDLTICYATTTVCPFLPILSDLQSQLVTIH